VYRRLNDVPLPAIYGPTADADGNEVLRRLPVVVVLGGTIAIVERASADRV
jgi:hypothetical protein